MDGVDFIGSPDWWVGVALMVPETWGSFVRLLRDITLTMEQVSTELCVCVNGNTYM